MKNALAITAIEDGAPRAPLVLRGDLAHSIETAAKLGYSAIEIHVIDAPTFPTDAVCDACRKHDISIASIVTGQIFTRRHLCITSPDKDNRDAAMKELYDYIDIAATVEATDGIVIGWIKGNRPESGGAAYDDLLASQLRDLGRYAARKGQKILVEVINRYETNVFNTARELVDFLNRYQLENTYVHLDTFHMNIEEADMVEAIRTAGGRLGYFHVADSNRLVPGRGHTDFVSLFSALKEVGYQGAISLECIPDPDSLTTGAEGYAYLTDAMKRC